MGEGVEAAVVDAEAESVIMLFREKCAGCKRGVGWLDPAVACVLDKWDLRARSSSGFIR